MKKVSMSLSAFVLVFCLMYLLGVFAQASFDVSKWTKEARIIVSIFSGLLGLVLGIVTFLYLEYND